MEKTEIFNELSKLINPETIRIDKPMKKHTSFKIGGNADVFVYGQSKEDIKKVLGFARENDIPVTIVGNGTNLLVLDGGIRGIVLKPDIRKIEIVENEIYVGAGNTLAEIAYRAYEASLTGFEFAGGIPGSMGGAIKMNAGAHGGEIKDVVVEVSSLNSDLEEVVLSSDDCGFAYRNSHFFDKFSDYVILDAKITLRPRKS